MPALLTRAVGALTAGGAIAVVRSPAAAVIYLAAAAGSVALLLLAVVLFVPTATASSRLAELIRAWRKP